MLIINLPGAAASIAAPKKDSATGCADGQPGLIIAHGDSANRFVGVNGDGPHKNKCSSSANEKQESENQDGPMVAHITLDTVAD